eukprot:2143708-Heterocapsa_arctica.AAC.1
MRRGGKSSGPGRNCHQTCGFNNHHSNPNCASVACQTWGGGATDERLDSEKFPQREGEPAEERPQGQGWKSQGKGHQYPYRKRI